VLTVSLDLLADLLVDDARGDYAKEAAAHLIVAHDRWLRRDDFLAACVNYDHHLDGRPVAWIDWAEVPTFVDERHHACSSSEARILSIAAELAGTDTGVPIDELLTGLDDINAGLVLDAFAHALTRGGRR
jgi:ABC-type branched-subunit amino acid transport system ATPase component